MISKVFSSITVLIIALMLFTSWYVVDTGHIAVEKTLGTVDMEEVPAGLNWKLPLLTQAYEFSAKEIAIDFNDLRPKARDNLRLQDLDISIYYKVDPSKISEMMVKYAASYTKGKDALLPAYNVVYREGRDVIYEEVTKIDSLALHRNRDQLRLGIATELQLKLDDKDPGIFTITRVAIRALNTDPTIEAAIQKAVQAQKTLEAKKVEVEIAGKDAEIEIARARGIAEANAIINSSLTPEYLQHELNEALKMFANNEGGVIVVPANMQNMSLMMDTKSIRKGN
ncbi:SPFH domain-containing protein [Thalassotalea ponticola]|uniref:SPFH domain-containing protein n=1 Tax=Thalassotalea ponticola TaxID=1523392 RepID=UPI0025B5CC62|nr:SPFH domain-containing protein [Thalassotalea ponticola]MDN3653308.1 SPFH domain-containing protein [Thalassotalea ponticola]